MDYYYCSLQRMKSILVLALLSQTITVFASEKLRLSGFSPTDTPRVYTGEFFNDSEREVHFDATDAFRFEFKTDEGWKEWLHHPSNALPNWVRVSPSSKQEMMVRIPEIAFKESFTVRVVLIVIDSGDTKIVHRITSPALADTKSGANRVGAGIEPAPPTPPGMRVRT
ncbi:hypothetical protein VSU19_00035, partial [Verrucomicrobiales bacterium BCK34]|nr:hypothetical protein [Verrucomicrobiales bacterium BCK34]